MTEQVFNLNGLGMLFVEAIAHRDYTLTQALVLLVATVFIVVNFLVDLALRLARSADPVPLMASNPPVEILADVAAAEPARRGGWTAPASSRAGGPLGALGAAFIVLMLVGRGSWRRSWPRTTRSPPTTAPCSRRPARSTGSAPTPSAATSTRASSTARGRRSWWASAPRWSAPRSGAVLGVVSAYFGGRIDLILQRLHGRVPVAPADHPGAGGRRDPRDRRPQRHRGHHRPDDPARAPGSSARAPSRVPRDAVRRGDARGRRRHLRIIFRHMLPNVDGALPDHADGLPGPGHPAGGVAVVPRASASRSRRRPGG